MINALKVIITVNYSKLVPADRTLKRNSFVLIRLMKNYFKFWPMIKYFMSVLSPEDINSYSTMVIQLVSTSINFFREASSRKD